MFELMESNDTQQLHFAEDPFTGLKAVIAIHSTVRGPAIGGCRFIPYINDEAAITDALRLAKGMSYKSALAGLPHGGGKAVVIKPKRDFNRTELMKSFGRFVDKLGGDYITAMDSGTQTSDMDIIQQVTPWVSCTSRSGDPSGHTALGVFSGLKAAAEFRFNSDSLKGVHVALQGLGHVGYKVAKLLSDAGAKLTVTDIDEQRIKLCQQEFEAQSVSPEKIYQVDADIFCPCGLGAVLNKQTLPQLKVQIIAGSANNQLAQEEIGDQLASSNILYAPDYLINAGGLIFVASQYAKTDESLMLNKINQIGPTLKTLFQEAQQTGVAVHRIANLKAQSIIDSATAQYHSAA